MPRFILLFIMFNIYSGKPHKEDITMEDVIQQIDDLTEELMRLKEDDNFDESQVDDIIYELNNFKEVIETVEED